MKNCAHCGVALDEQNISRSMPRFCNTCGSFAMREQKTKIPIGMQKSFGDPKCCLGPDGCKGVLELNISRDSKVIRGWICRKHGGILSRYENSEIDTLKLENFIAGRLSNLIFFDGIKTCNEESCSKPHFTGGLCRNHYKIKRQTVTNQGASEIEIEGMVVSESEL